MTTEQHIVRWILLLPTFIIMLIFLPAQGGQYQFMGIFDVDFLGTGVDWFKLLVTLGALVVAWIILEQYAARSMELQDNRPKKRGSRYANTSVEMTPIRACLALLLLLVCLAAPAGFGKHAWENAQISRVTSAAKSGDLAALQAMLKQHPNYLEAQGFHGRTPLFWAAFAGQSKMVVYLVEKKAKLNVKDARGWTPAHAAAWRNQKEVMLDLVDLKADLKAVDKEGNTPLHVAAMGDNRDAAEVLLDMAVPIDAVNNEGNTPLHVAAMQKQEFMVSLLLDKGAAINIRNKKKFTPLALAHQVPQNQNTTTILVDRGGEE